MTIIRDFLTAVLVLLPVVALAATLTSDPSDVATHWKIQLENGTEYQAEVVNGALHWDISGLSIGIHNGTAHFGVAEWELQEGSKDRKYYDLHWSEGTSFQLKRNPVPQSPTNLEQ